MGVGGDDKIQAVDDPTHDISPFDIRHMAGNGEEFTRTSRNSELNDDWHRLQPDTKVDIRGLTWAVPEPIPLTYAEFQQNLEVPSATWQSGNESSSERSFRVALEIPGE